MSDMEISADGRLTVDYEADAAYLYLTGVGEVDHTVMVDAVTNVDVDEAGRVTGVELLNLSAPLPVAVLGERFGLTAEELEPLVRLEAD